MNDEVKKYLEGSGLNSSYYPGSRPEGRVRYKHKNFTPDLLQWLLNDAVAHV